MKGRFGRYEGRQPRYKTGRLFKSALLPLLVVSAFSLPPSIRATTLARVSLDQLAAAADGVARVRCDGVQSRWENGSIWTVTTFDVVEQIKGKLPSQIVVRLPGGRVGALTATVDGTPKFSPSEEAIVFLADAHRGILRGRLGGRNVSNRARREVASGSRHAGFERIRRL